MPQYQHTIQVNLMIDEVQDLLIKALELPSNTQIQFEIRKDNDIPVCKKVTLTYKETSESTTVLWTTN